ncbi:endophilin-B2 isoform X3 [Drosophila virilis]|uniref:endophilin-B2 isoform X3 n=1 Tax=Drosophila virilis TaxID=7244 RepID=UPI001395F148|nr:endophilin-B2 isoform X4 [Drosophila virilis]
MNINLPNFNMKNLVKEAGSTISRVVQLTEEKLGTTERTEYDIHFQNLAERADVTKTWTEKLVRDTESVLIPNPQNRVEDYIFEKIEKSKPKRLSNLEHLALDMIEAGGDFGQDMPYGQALIKVGQAEQKLGQCEHDFIATSGICFTQPLRKFLEGEMKTISKERGILETKRRSATCAWLRPSSIDSRRSPSCCWTASAHRRHRTCAICTPLSRPRCGTTNSAAMSWISCSASWPKCSQRSHACASIAKMSMGLPALLRLIPVIQIPIPLH